MDTIPTKDTATNSSLVSDRLVAPQNPQEGPEKYKSPSTSPDVTKGSSLIFDRLVAPQMDASSRNYEITSSREENTTKNSPIFDTTKNSPIFAPQADPVKYEITSTGELSSLLRFGQEKHDISSMKEDKSLKISPTLDRLVAPQAGPREYEIVYFNVLLFGSWHLGGLLGLYLCFTSAKWATILFNAVLHVVQVLGVNAGAHRLWSHRSFKAKMPLQILLMLFHSISSQTTAFHWARDHRLHHKYSDTDADPHNATRGLFYSHVGWLLVKKHPEAVKRGRTIDMSDLYDNPVLQFQKKYYLPLTGMLTFVLPTIIPMHFWDEIFAVAFTVSLLRLVVGLNLAFLVNSGAHRFGNKPYDKTISPTQSITLSLATLGECFHNYHHVFPFDYRTGELGNNYINVTTKFIDFFAWIGWAYDLKSASDEMIMKRGKRTGDGTDLWGREKNDDAESSSSDT